MFSWERRKITFLTTFGCLKVWFSKVVRSAPPRTVTQYKANIGLCSYKSKYFYTRTKIWKFFYTCAPKKHWFLLINLPKIWVHVRKTFQELKIIMIFKNFRIRWIYTFNFIFMIKMPVFSGDQYRYSVLSPISVIPVLPIPVSNPMVKRINIYKDIRDQD